jgi:hypothetical protein
MNRTQEQFVSKLPPFKASRSKDFPAFLMVMCGYDDCPGTKSDRPFLVAEREWLRPHRLVRESPRGKPVIIVGRACPYCFRTGRLPRRSDIS